MTHSLHINAKCWADEFPLLSRTMRGKRLAYLDNAASTQKPQVVIDAVSHYYTVANANIHRGLYQISEEATIAYEHVRDQVAEFIQAKRAKEIVFTSGTTNGINCIARTFGRQCLKAGDEVLITGMAHHANIVPWVELAKQRGIVLKVVPLNETGQFSLSDYADLLSEKTALVSITHISNVTGVINPIKQMIQLAQERGIPTLIDGAQAVAHEPVNVVDLGCDFYVFSSHKLFGPTGVGVLYARDDWLDRLPPYEGGGDMIKRVSFEAVTYNDPPYKFEAGTPNIAGVIGFGAALDYLKAKSWSDIIAHEHHLSQVMLSQLSAVPGVRILGPLCTDNRVSVYSFELAGIHAHDLGTLLDQSGVAIRAGHHCAMPLMKHFNVPATVRASLSFYNTEQDIMQFIAGLHTARDFLN